MDEAAPESNINPALRKMNERNRAFWDARNAIEAKLASDPTTAHYVIEKLRVQQFHDSLLREVQGAAAAASSALEKKTAELAAASADLAEASSKLRRIHEGATQREDQLDKQRFIQWVRTEAIRIERIGDLRPRPGFIWGKYGRKTLKSWYRVAMPDVELRAGRPISE